MKRILLSLICISFPFAATGQTASSPRRIVLVHGFMNTGQHFQFIQRRLEKSGHTCYAPSLTPSDGRGGLENLAAQLKQDIDTRYGPDQKITLIGFSMGGIISRYYLQELGGARRCEAFMTISSPHHGTLTAWCYPTKGSAQMRPDSGFLCNLSATENRLGQIPVTSYHTPMDLMILPARSSVWERAENISYPVAAHPLMLFSTVLLKDIERKLAIRQ